MADTIKGNQDGPRGENESYKIPGRGSAIPRPIVVREVEQGKHPHFSVYKRDGVKYVRGNPNAVRKDNVND
jgi:hypothetical protein